MNITDWISCISTAISCVLTGIYVVFTIRIFKSNKQSADAAHEQIKEAREIQKENVALQLLNQRIEIYRTLNTWVQNAKIISSGDKPYVDTLPILGDIIFYNVKNEMTGIMSGLKKDIDNPDCSDLEKKNLNKKLGQLERHNYLKVIAELNEQYYLIELAEVCFFESDYKIIKEFSNAYMDIAVYIQNEINNKGNYIYSNSLKNCTRKIVDMKILEKMKEEMKI